MFGKITPSQRLKTGLALGLVFILVFATNQVDKKHFEKAQYNLRSIFEDRLVVKGYLYELQEMVYEEELALADSTAQGMMENPKLDTLIQKYGETRLTPRERSHFEDLQEELKQYARVKSNSPNLLAWNNQLDRIHNTLDALAEIQLKEGEVLNKSAEKSLDFTAFISQLEVIILILTGIIVQFLIFYRPKK